MSYCPVSVFVHPEDRAAMENLKSMPLLPQVTRLFLKVFSEQMVHGLNMAGKIRLGPEQLPDLYRRLPPICERLGIEEPEFYLEMDPSPNARTYGDTRVFVSLTSGLVEYLESDELDAVIAHECGHIACRHVLYHTMARFLATYGLEMLGPLGFAARPVVWALMYWSRRSEFSADRAAAYALGDSRSVIETMIRFSGGPRSLTGAVNLDRYLEQANAYDRLSESNWDKFLQTVAVAEMTHPFPAVRAREIAQWCAKPEFQELVARCASGSGPQGEAPAACPHCSQPTGPGWRFCMGCGKEIVPR